MADVFISYKREDRARIEPLARGLEKCGYTVWWDLELVPSQKFERQIKTELDVAKCVVVVWTVGSLDEAGMYRSEWVHNEAESGNHRGILAPVQLDPGCVHWRHGQNQFAELHNWTGQEEAPGFVALLRGVALLAGRRERPFDQEFAAWITAEKAESAGAFRKFLASFPDSRFAAIARSRAADLEETDAWTAMGDQPSVRELTGFLRKFPAGRFGDEAEAKIEALTGQAERQPDDEPLQQPERRFDQTWRVHAESIVGAQLGRRLPTTDEWRILSDQERNAIGQLIYEPARFDFERVKLLATNAVRSSLLSRSSRHLQYVKFEIDRFLQEWAGFLVWREKESPYRDNWRAEIVALRRQAVEALPKADL